MSRKIAIFTIQSRNYGNRLQNYASYQTLKKMGNNVYVLQTISLETKKNAIGKNHKRLKRALFLYPVCIELYKVYKVIFKRTLEANYLRFNRYLTYSNDYIELDNYSNNFKRYDAIIAGSDQIWNTNFKDVVSINSFLLFAHPNKISFSASFGVDSIPYDQKIVDCLNDFKALSVREEAGAKIIKDLTGRDATVLVDPTMLLSVDEWRKVSKKPKGVKDGYILTYFLSPKCDEAANQLNKIRDGREVYELLHREDKVAGTAGPSEFLWLFDHADFILTDSFHACVFSFLFNKPFIVFNRQYDGVCMNSRLETLLSKFHLERKYAGSGLTNDLWEHDYSEGYKQLEIEREKAMSFLKEALGEESKQY